jgi:hypothetical protein
MYSTITKAEDQSHNFGHGTDNNNAPVTSFVTRSSSSNSNDNTNNNVQLQQSPARQNVNYVQQSQSQGRNVNYVQQPQQQRQLTSPSRSTSITVQSQTIQSQHHQPQRQIIVQTQQRQPERPVPAAAAVPPVLAQNHVQSINSASTSTGSSSYSGQNAPPPTGQSPSEVKNIYRTALFFPESPGFTI